MADLTGKTVSELPQTSALIDSDLFLVSKSGASRASTFELLKNYVMRGVSVALADTPSVTVDRASVWRYGSLLTVSVRITTSAAIASNGNVLTFPDTFRAGVLQDVVGNSTDGPSQNFYIPANSPYLRTSGALPAGSYTITGTIHLTAF